MMRLIILALLILTGCSFRGGQWETPSVDIEASTTTLVDVDESPAHPSATAVRLPPATRTPSPSSDPSSQAVPASKLLLGPDDLASEWGVATNPVWSPGGDQILFALKVDNNLYYPAVLDLRAGEQIIVQQAMVPSELEMVWAPDGRHFAFMAPYERLDGRSAHDVFVGTLDPARAFRISPRDSEVYRFHRVRAWLDAQTVLYESFTNQFRLRVSGLFVSRIDEPGSSLLIWSGVWPDVSTDRQWIAYIEQGQLWIADHQGLERTAVLDEEHVGRFIIPRWSPDGDWIAILDYEKDELYIVARDGSSLTKVADNVIASDYKWSPDGQFLLCARGDQWNQEWDLYLVEWRTEGMIQLTEGPGEGQSFDLSPDGMEVVFSRREEGTPWEALYLIDLNQIDREAPADE